MSEDDINPIPLTEDSASIGGSGAIDGTDGGLRIAG